MTPRIVEDHSPLTRLPAALHPAQRGWLEGVRYSTEIADLAMRRLSSVLYELAFKRLRTEGVQQSAIEPDFYIAALADAWTFLDATWRLKRLLIDNRLPHNALGSRPPLESVTDDSREFRVTQFRDAMGAVKELRDGFQHLDNFAARSAEQGKPVWGYLNWVVLHPDLNRAQTCLLVPGVCGPGEANFNLVNPAGIDFHAPVEHITLTAFGKEADLSELHRRIAAVIKNLEEVVRPQLAGHAPHMATILLVLEAEFGKTEDERIG